MNQNSLKQLLPMILVFVLVTSFLITGRSWLAEKGVDQDVLLIGNLVLFLVSLISFLITFRSLRTENPHAFVRGIYTSFIAKFFLVAIAAFIYIMIAKSVNKAALFTCMGLYIVYAFMEVTTLLRILKQKKNA
jgi:hypothetical protein